MMQRICASSRAVDFQRDGAELVVVMQEPDFIEQAIGRGHVDFTGEPYHRDLAVKRGADGHARHPALQWPSVFVKTTRRWKSRSKSVDRLLLLCAIIFVATVQNGSR